MAALLVLPTVLSRADDAVALLNPGFEDGIQNWVTSKEDDAAKMSQAIPGAAHSGQSGLEVKTDESSAGSWVQSAKAQILGGKTYRATFWARCPVVSGVGVFIQFFTDDGKPLDKAISMQVPPNTKDWTELHLDAKAPDAAASLTVAVHAFSKQICQADFDDFSVAILSDAAAAAAPSAPSATPAPAPAPAAAYVPPPPLPAIDPARVAEIASYLEPKAKGIGPSLDDRAAWDALSADVELHDKVMPRAVRFLSEPTPEISNELWMESCRTSNRKAEPFLDRRRFRTITWILAEGMENKGQFLPAIEKEINVICAEPTWVLPAHDKQMLNFNGTQKMVDLGVGMTAWTLATADSILGDKLSAETRKLIRDKTRERIIEPFLSDSKGDTKIEWWRTDANNWNAVVHGGVIGTTLALDDDIQERAQIIASVEKEIQFYLNGFPKDGYSMEGMGYWKYGFGHYIMLSEAILRATKGKVNLYASDQARLVAQFPRRFEIVPGIYPAFGDCLFNEEPAQWLYHVINCRYGLGDNDPKTLTVDGMYSALLYANGTNLTFDSSAPPLYTQGGEAFHGHQLRDWFEDGQVLVARLPEGKTGLNIAFKGGTNGASHGHTDLGTFVAVVGRQPLLVDPGSTNYGTTTFSTQRFSNEILNSYGHSVPKVAGKLQEPGKAYDASVVSKNFSDVADSVTLDLSKGYIVPELKKLTRQFDYSRADKGALTVTDAVEYSSPQAFGTALVTYGDAKEEKPGIWTVTQNGETVRVEISAGGLPFTVVNEELKDAARAGKVHRLGIDLNAPAGTATITIKITPAT